MGVSHVSASAAAAGGRPDLLHDHLLVVGDHPLADGVVAAAARRNAPVTWITNGKVSRPIPGVEPRRNLYGVSFAVAQVTGWIAARGLCGRDAVMAACAELRTPLRADAD